MSCEYFNKCVHCCNQNCCPYDFMGDGSPFCPEFACGVDECKRSICISDEELEDAYEKSI